MKRFWTLALLAALGLGAVLLVRALLFAPAPAERADSTTLPPAPEVDVARAAQHLGEAVRFRTVSHQDPREDDGAAWDALQAWLAATYPAAHRALALERVAGRTLLYTWPGRNAALPPVILMAHQDVVPVEPGTEGAWRHAPFGGEIADGAVWGRGTVDDKGSLVALFEAIDALAAHGYAPERTLLLVSGHNEEVAGSGAHAAAEALAARGVHAEFVLDEGLVIAASDPIAHRPAALVGVAEKGYASLEITAEGAGGHSSMPPPRTAVSVLAEALLAVERRGADAPRLAGPARELLAGLAPGAPWGFRFAMANDWLLAPLIVRAMRGTPAGAAMLQTTLAPTMLSGSPKDNVLAERATAVVNYRLRPGDPSAAALERARRAVGALPVRLAWLAPPNEASPVSSSHSRGWRLIAALGADAAGGRVAPGLMIGATDARWMQAVADDVYRFQPITLGEADYAMIHGTNEHMTLANLAQAVRFYSRLVAAATGPAAP